MLAVAIFARGKIVVLPPAGFAVVSLSTWAKWRHWALEPSRESPPSICGISTSHSYKISFEFIKNSFIGYREGGNST